jgi:hypothetical protein
MATRPQLSQDRLEPGCRGRNSISQHSSPRCAKCDQKIQAATMNLSCRGSRAGCASFNSAAEIARFKPPIHDESVNPDRRGQTNERDPA